MFIDVLLSEGGEHGAGFDGADAATAARRNNREGAQEAHYTNSLLIHLREDNKELQNKITRVHERERRMMQVINKNLRQMMRSPALMHGHNLVRDRPASISDSSQEYSEHKHVIDDVISTLSQNLITLHEIWNEWEFGIGNRKVAKDFLIMLILRHQSHFCA